MAHEVEKMAYVGEMPWHKLGTEMTEDSTFDEWLVAAGMNWTIESSPVLYTAGGNAAVFNGQNVLYRSDTNAPLAIASDKYKVVQPAQVLEFFRDFIDYNGFSLHTAGVLRKGKRFWALAETGTFDEVSRGDGIGGYLLLSTSCDRTLATTARFTTVRVVCNNTLSLAYDNNANSVSFSHISEFNPDNAKKRLGEVVDSFGAFMDTAKILQKQMIDMEAATEFVKSLTTERAADKIIKLFDGKGMGAEETGHTKWGLLNAITEYVDHHAPTRSDRMDSAWFGNGAKIKDKALALMTA
jgi:phage/plasmid-like protein (TIGR03299 family)